MEIWGVLLTAISPENIKPSASVFPEKKTLAMILKILLCITEILEFSNNFCLSLFLRARFRDYF